MWAPLAIVGAFVALVVLLHVTSVTSGNAHQRDHNQWAPATTTTAP
jgi:hypothetical protein